MNDSMDVGVVNKILNFADDTKIVSKVASEDQTVTIGNRTLRTQDTSVPRHFGTSAEVSGQFGPKTLRHQNISALVSGHFGTNAWTIRHYSIMPLRQCTGLQ